MPKRNENWVRQRAERVDVGRARLAATAVTPVRAKLGQWQVQAARLRVLAKRRVDAGEPIDEINSAVEQMLAEIERDRQLLAAKSAELPPEVVMHSRFQDILRALATASDAMNAILATR